jgi:hypothetical protein
MWGLPNLSHGVYSVLGVVHVHTLPHGLWMAVPLSYPKTPHLIAQPAVVMGGSLG